jgi:hypothetical protein
MEKAWCFVDAQGRKLYTWTVSQLKAAWREIQRQTDLTLEELAQVDWSQVLLDIGKGLLILTLVIAGTVVVIVLAKMLVAALLVLVAALVTGGGAALAALAATLGAATLVTAAAR